MKKFVFYFLLIVSIETVTAQGYGIVRKNFFSMEFDSSLNTFIEVFDSSTIRLGTIDATNGNVINVGPYEYSRGINLTGATMNPYLNQYIIGSGNSLLTFDMTDGKLVNTAQINGPLQTTAFQNYRFNTSDTTIYGLIPNNFYSTYYDSTIMDFIEQLDSQQIRFAKINPTTGEYSLIGNTSLKGPYTLAGNSIDPYQMVYYYSAVDTLVGIDLYSGEIFSQVKIQLPQNTLFENITYSCIDTAIYALARQNYFSLEYDSSLQEFIEEFDSFTVKLCKIDPNNGTVTIISPNNIGLFSVLTSRSFIDPNTMSYYFNTGSRIVGISLTTGQITSNKQLNYEDGGIAFDLMLSKENCFGSRRVRPNISSGVFDKNIDVQNKLTLYPNPTQNNLFVTSDKPLDYLEVIDLNGKVQIISKESNVNITSLSSGMYLVTGHCTDGSIKTARMIKN